MDIALFVPINNIVYKIGIKGNEKRERELISCTFGNISLTLHLCGGVDDFNHQ